MCFNFNFDQTQTETVGRDKKCTESKEVMNRNIQGSLVTPTILQNMTYNEVNIMCLLK